MKDGTGSFDNSRLSKLVTVYSKEGLLCADEDPAKEFWTYNLTQNYVYEIGQKNEMCESVAKKFEQDRLKKWTPNKIVKDVWRSPSVGTDEKMLLKSEEKSFWF